ncbi:MAG: aminoacyl-tRNA hydrolase [Clostridia bacterium]|nr:aminoacyl-tRNA hydrolase [Clostridia bacterium]
MSNIFDLFDKIGSNSPTPTGRITHLVVGLGNPGDKYAFTRHNAGFLALDFITQKLEIKTDKVKFKSICGEAVISGKRTLFMKPQTFMNLSGEAVREAADFYKIPPENILVICDDVNFDVGVLRIRRKGSDGGQNGVKNIIYQLGSDEFPRIKVGVGKKPSPDYDMKDFVLSQFGEAEKKTLFSTFENIYNSVELVLDDKIDEAMSRYSKGKK